MNVEVLPGREIPNQPGRLGDRTVGGRERDLTRERRRAGRSSLERGAEDPHLRVAPRPGIDLARAEVAVRALLEAVGADPSGEALRDTPRRVAHAYAELLTPRHFTLTTFPNDEGYDELVVARDIPFTPSANTTSFRSSGGLISVTCRVSASSGSPSWPEW
jgi:hypothetical protein